MVGLLRTRIGSDNFTPTTVAFPTTAIPTKNKTNAGSQRCRNPELCDLIETAGQKYDADVNYAQVLARSIPMLTPRHESKAVASPHDSVKK